MTYRLNQSPRYLTATAKNRETRTCEDSRCPSGRRRTSTIYAMSARRMLKCSGGSRGRPPKLGVSRFTYDPGARMPCGHRHRVQEEAYVVVAGSGRAKLDDEVVELSAWDVLRVTPAVVRSFEAGRRVLT